MCVVRVLAPAVPTVSEAGLCGLAFAWSGWVALRE